MHDISSFINSGMLTGSQGENGLWFFRFTQWNCLISLHTKCLKYLNPRSRHFLCGANISSSRRNKKNYKWAWYGSSVKLLYSKHEHQGYQEWKCTTATNIPVSLCRGFLAFENFSYVKRITLQNCSHETSHIGGTLDGILGVDGGPKSNELQQ